MHLVVGLGNPGQKYQATRHNLGWRVIDVLARRHQLGAGRGDHRAITWDGLIGEKRVKLAKPVTYMNRSGESLRALISYYRLPLDNLLLIHDDLDTPFGSLRLRKSGGHGGQNGLRSIIQHLGSRDFARLRFGIGRPPGRMSAMDYVLQPLRGEQSDLADALAERAADAVETWLRDGIERAMSDFNGDIQRDRSKPPRRDLEERLRVFQRAHELAPRDRQPLIQLIALQKKLGKLDEALANHLKLAQVYAEAGEIESSYNEKLRAVAIDPGLVDLQRDIAEWHLRSDRGKQAVRRYLILAEYYRQQGDMAAARATVDIALALNPQHPKALKMRDMLSGATER